MSLKFRVGENTVDTIALEDVTLQPGAGFNISINGDDFTITHADTSSMSSLSTAALGSIIDKMVVFQGHVTSMTRTSYLSQLVNSTTRASMMLCTGFVSTTDDNQVLTKTKISTLNIAGIGCSGGFRLISQTSTTFTVNRVDAISGTTNTYHVLAVSTHHYS